MIWLPFNKNPLIHNLNKLEYFISVQNLLSVSFEVLIYDCVYAKCGRCEQGNE